MFLYDYCQNVRSGNYFKERKNYGTTCPFPRQQMYNGLVSNHVPVHFMAMPGSLKENILICFTIPPVKLRGRALSEMNAVNASAEHRQAPERMQGKNYEI